MLFMVELREVQPTVVVTTPAVWTFVATAVRDRVANSSRQIGSEKEKQKETAKEY